MTNIFVSDLGVNSLYKFKHAFYSLSFYMFLCSYVNSYMLTVYANVNIPEYFNMKEDINI